MNRAQERRQWLKRIEAIELQFAIKKDGGENVRDYIQIDSKR